MLSTPLPPAQFRYVSAHVGDDGDWAFQRGHDLTWIEPGQLIAGQAIAGPIHIHFDLDALDPAEFPHVAYPDGRLPFAAGLALIRSAAAAGLVGLTITGSRPPTNALRRKVAAFLSGYVKPPQKAMQSIERG